jgi:hypothetical protein
MKKLKFEAAEMLQFLIAEMKLHNETSKSRFRFESVDQEGDAIYVLIKNKNHKVVFVERDGLFAIFLNDVEIAAFAEVEDVIYFLLV